VILCQGPNDKIQVVSSQSIAVDCHVSAMDYDGSNATSYRKNTAITTASTTDISVAPASGITRNIKTINIRNKNNSTNTIITVQHTDGTTTVELYRNVVGPGQTLQYVEGVGWSIIAALTSMAAKISSTIGGLNTLFGGTPVDGSLGELILGSTPYDFIGLVYSATYAKWISDAVPLLTGISGNQNVTAYTTLGQPTTVLWDVFANAGLTPQFRIRGQVHVNSGTETTTLAIGIAGIAVGASAVPPYAGTEFAAATGPGAVDGFVDSGWATPTLSAVVSALSVAIRVRSSGNTIAKTQNQIQVEQRWTS